MGRFAANFRNARGRRGARQDFALQEPRQRLLRIGEFGAASRFDSIPQNLLTARIFSHGRQVTFGT